MDLVERSLDVPGARLRYVDHGTGPAVVLMHGFTLDLEIWRPQLEHLAARHRVIAYDRRGFGGSSAPGAEPYSHADDADLLLGQLGVERAHVIGHSQGALAALELALAHPTRVAGLALLAPFGLSGVPMSFDLMGLFKSLKKAALADGASGAREVWKTKAPWFKHARERPELRALVDAAIDRYSGWHWLHDDPVTNLDPPPAARLGELKIPVRILDGEKDHPYIHGVVEALTRGIPGAELVRLDGVGHMLGLEAPDGTHRALDDLLAR